MFLANNKLKSRIRNAVELFDRIGTWTGEARG